MKWPQKYTIFKVLLLCYREIGKMYYRATRGAIFVCVICLATVGNQQHANAQSHDCSASKTSRKEDSAEPQRVRKLFSVLDATLENGHFSFADMPVFAIYDDRQVIFLDPNTFTKFEECSCAYRQTRLTRNAFRDALHKLGTGRLRKHLDKGVSLVDTWNESQIIFLFGDGKGRNSITTFGMSISEIYETYNIDEFVEPAQLKDYSLRNMYDLAFHVPTDFLITFRFLCNFRPESAKLWQPNWLEVFLVPSKLTDKKTIWPKELPVIKITGQARKWHSREAKGSMLIAGKYLPQLQKLCKMGTFVAIGGGQSVGWRCVMPDENERESKCANSVSSDNREGEGTNVEK